MGIKKIKVCECCGGTFPANRKFFIRRVNPETRKESLSNNCRECELKIEHDKHWDGSKLRCLICGRSLDPSEFDNHTAYAIRNHKDSRCKECKLKQNQEARKNYSDSEKLYKTLLARVLGAKERALRKNIPCTITLNYVLDLWKKQKGLCAISKIPMTYELDSGRIYTNVSIDLINQGKGYTEDNVQLVCMAVNQLKSDWEMSIVLYICKLIVTNNE